jgi:uncharacterized protein YpuA (DUF1002 family)
MADYLDVCLQINTTPNEDAAINTVGSFIDKVEVKSIQDSLLQDYNINLTENNILEIMEHEGIDYSNLLANEDVSELIYLSTLEED